MTDIKNQIIEINRYIIRQTVDSSLGDPKQSSAIIDITISIIGITHQQEKE